jgi:hypothetical protein
MCASERAPALVYGSVRTYRMLDDSRGQVIGSYRRLAGARA